MLDTIVLCISRYL